MISTTGEYALRAAIYLAQHHGTPQTTAQIAGGTKVPQGYLSKILQALVRGGLLRGQRGLGGGFVLLADPEEVTVLDVLRAVDSAPKRIKRCPLGLTGHVRLCPLHHLVDEAIGETEEAFRKANLKDMLSSTQGVQPLCSE